MAGDPPDGFQFLQRPIAKRKDVALMLPRMFVGDVPRALVEVELTQLCEPNFAAPLQGEEQEH